jgi:ParB/RepB/Spo0J family partition protein
MRADAHYVEQLTSRSPDMSVRFIAIDEIDAAERPDAHPLEPLTRSIAALGVVQPLLVRHDDKRYELIAGHRRLAAARAAGLTTVPCLIHQADAEKAELLAQADNLHAGQTEPPTAAGTFLRSGPVLARLSEQLAAIESTATLLASQTLPTARRVTIDMIRAEAWRASWLLLASGIGDNTHRGDTRLYLLGSVLERVRDGFMPESRLSGVELQVCVPDWNVSAVVDDQALMAGLSGALIATFGLVEESTGAVITLIASASPGGSLSIDIAQDAVTVPAEAASRFFDAAWTDRPGGWSAVVGALTARTVAQQHGGDALFMVRDRRGSTLRLNLDQTR